jgi:hypothetical protein
MSRDFLDIPPKFPENWGIFDLPFSDADSKFAQGEDCEDSADDIAREDMKFAELWVLAERWQYLLSRTSLCRSQVRFERPAAALPS